MREHPAYLGLCKKQLPFTLLHRKGLTSCFTLLTNYIEESIGYEVYCRYTFVERWPLHGGGSLWCVWLPPLLPIYHLVIRKLDYWSYTWQPRSNDLAFCNTNLLQNYDMGTTQGTWIFTNTFEHMWHTRWSVMCHKDQTAV